MEAAWQYHIPVSPERLWPYVSDTDRVNRAAGLPPVTYRIETAADGKPRTIATAKRGLLRISWEEPPFAWEVPQRLGITRRFIGGPFALFISDVRLTREPGGTLLEHRIELVPRNAVGRLLAPLVVAMGSRGASRAYAQAAEAAIARAAGPPAPSARTQEEAVLEERFFGALAREPALEGKLETLRGLVGALAAFLETTEERELARIKPYAVADRLMVDRRELLALMLALTRAGFLDLSWDVICGGCRRPQQFDSLSEVRPSVHCPMCNVSFGPEFDRNIEVTFGAAPLGKGIDVPVFCAVGPHENRQVYAQSAVPAGERVAFDVTLEAGRFAIQISPERSAAFQVDAQSSVSEIEATVDADAVRLSAPSAAPGRVRLAVVNAMREPLLAKVVEAGLPPDIATAADVTAIQEFRDLFSSEVLASGLELAIRSMTIVFSDLVGSTQMYTSHGDAPAFRLVSEHFGCLRDLIAGRRGAVVKTIGDAVMAVFVDPGDAFDAAVRFAAAVGIVQGPTGSLEIRVGMHTGPCIAMRANDRLDYFGTTVNLAARIGHIAAAGEVSLSATTAGLPSVARRLAQRERRVENVSFKGIGAPVAVVHVAADR
jgi:class 3 adenylate cyclase